MGEECRGEVLSFLHHGSNKISRIMNYFQRQDGWLRRALATMVVACTTALCVAQEIVPVDVRGVVTDEDGVPLAGATVVLKGTNKGVTTNGDGMFVIRVPDAGEAVLQVSFIGFQALEVQVNGRVVVPPVQLVAGGTEFDEVIVGPIPPSTGR
jgi:hypothetical protein